MIYLVDDLPRCVYGEAVCHSQPSLGVGHLDLGLGHDSSEGLVVIWWPPMPQILGEVKLLDI